MTLTIAAGLLSGCLGSQRLTPVDAESAREALKTTLDGWKKGDAPSALSSVTPPITAQDLDWLAGAKLVDYAVTSEGKSVEANLYVPVDLTLKMGNGKQVKKKVTYVVATSPYLAVFRALK
jgi:predicted Zn-dependent peptidase